jgi:hypothetical protein
MVSPQVLQRLGPSCSAQVIIDVEKDRWQTGQSMDRSSSSSSRSMNFFQARPVFQEFENLAGGDDLV